jgi:glyoxylase-like metal-dependent hydrolase (beta-lactamase superfamily II)
VKKIDGGPIRFLVNTHIRRDHTQGNAFFAKQGAVIFAREELGDGMVRLSRRSGFAGDGWGAGVRMVTTSQA